MRHIVVSCMLFLASTFAAGQSCTNCATCCCPNGESDCDQIEPMCPTSSGCCASPIIVDTTGHGFHLTSAVDGVMYDISGTGHPFKMAWTGRDSGNAFLVLDRNHNGKIDNGKEMFGNYTEQPPCPDGGDGCKNGYRALAEFDKPENGGNGDGIIDYHDAVFSRLRLWIDENHDGISQSNELHTLPELGAYSISLKYSDSHFRDQNGNWFHYSSSLNPDRQDGTSRDGRIDYDVFFSYYTSDGSWVLHNPEDWVNDRDVHESDLRLHDPE